MNVYLNPVKLNTNNNINYANNVRTNKNVAFQGGMHLGKIKPIIQQTLVKQSYDLENLIKKIISKLSRTKSLKKQNLPIVENAIIAFFKGLQDEKDFFKEIAEKKLNNEFILSKQLNNADILIKLESKRVIKEQAPWEAPRFNNGILTNRAYSDIVEKVKNAPTYILNNNEKKDILNKLAQSNYHNEDIIYGSLNFQGHTDSTLDNTDLAPEHDESLLDAFLDFLDDLF